MDNFHNNFPDTYHTHCCMKYNRHAPQHMFYCWQELDLTTCKSATGKEEVKNKLLVLPSFNFYIYGDNRLNICKWKFIFLFLLTLVKTSSQIRFVCKFLANFTKLLQKSEEVLTIFWKKSSIFKSNQQAKQNKCMFDDILIFLTKFGDFYLLIFIFFSISWLKNTILPSELIENSHYSKICSSNKRRLFTE